MDKRLGYYTCNGKEFESKLQALMWSNLVKQPINWHFNNEVFDKYTWSVDPELTLDQLYDRRAREIREKYDYILFSYSGGADSTNILESFQRQGLFIDEIVHNGTFEAAEKFTVLDPTQRSHWNLNAEYKLNTADKLNQIKLNSPNTKIVVNDTSKLIIDNFTSNLDGSWVKDKREMLNPLATNNFNYTHFRETRVNFDKGKRVALVLGLDKPKIRVVDGHCYLYFIDKIANIVPAQEHLVEYPNIRTEMFYWSPDSCDILAKQAHLVLRLINSDQRYRKIFEGSSDRMIRVTQEQLLRSVLYTNWKSEWFQVNKAMKDWDSEYDYWFTKGWRGTEAYEGWQRGVDHVIQRINRDDVKWNPDGSIFGTKPILSKFYYVGPVTS